MNRLFECVTSLMYTYYGENLELNILILFVE